jgi:hypothetical protein
VLEDATTPFAFDRTASPRTRVPPVNPSFGDADDIREAEPPLERRAERANGALNVAGDTLALEFSLNALGRDS